MNRKEFTNFDDAQRFIDDLVDEHKWAVDLRQNTKTGEYIVCWVEHKTYKSFDGKEYHDEVWTNEAGEMTCIQDLEAEHAKNILRMLLRNEREQRSILRAALEQVAASISAEIDEQEEVSSLANHTLH